MVSVSETRGFTRVVYIQYELTDEMFSKIEDPDALEHSCKQQPDQCTHQYICEFPQEREAACTQKKDLRKKEKVFSQPQVLKMHAFTWCRAEEKDCVSKRRILCIFRLA